MRADKILDKLDISYELVEQDSPTKTCDDAARERGIDTSQIVKSLIVESEGDRYHVCIPGDRTLAEKKLGKPRMVSPEESKKITGFDSGTVHPLSSDLKHFIDERVFENSKVSFTAGTEKEGVILDSDGLRSALEEKGFDFEIKNIVVINDEDIEQLKEKGLDEDKARFVADKGYRKIFLDLVDDFDTEELVTGIRKLHREEIDFDSALTRELVKQADNENHMHKLAEKLAENGELPNEEDDFKLETVIEETIKDNPDALEEYREGKNSALNYLIGQIMQQTNGRANATKARELIEERIE
jgi:prolyl-tRNA editing enzyme YbaK/EbsC (Cys-tRNA(Pro) deacylase)